MPSIGASLNPVRLVNKILGRNKKEKAKSTAAVAATQTKAPESVIAEGKPAPSVAAPTKVWVFAETKQSLSVWVFALAMERVQEVRLRPGYIFDAVLASVARRWLVKTVLLLRR